MGTSDLTADDGYQSLLGKISQVYATGQLRAHQAVHAHITVINHPFAPPNSPTLSSILQIV